MSDTAQIDALERDLAVLQDGDSEELHRLIARADGYTTQLSRSVRESPDLFAGAARVDENLILARMAQNGTEPGGYDAATFHLRRAIELLRALDQDVLEETRRLDRVRNRDDFLSG